MTEVLSQDEIDALLQTISIGEPLEEDTRTTVKKKKKIKIYDFKRPDKFSKDQIRTIHIMHETFARLNTTSLSALLRSLVHVHVASVDQLTYEEFVRSIPSPTTLAVIHMDPMKGSSLLEIDPSITFTMIDRLFGGQGQPLKLNRELTDVEIAVIEGIIIRILGNLRESWANVIDLRPRLGLIETNPQFAQIVPPNDMVVLVTLEARVGDVEGMINYCIPYITLEPIIGKLSAQYWYSSVRQGDAREYRDILKEQIEPTIVDLVAEIGTREVPLNDILNVRVGDVIRLSGIELDHDIKLRVGDKIKFQCRPGKKGKRVAVQITGVLAPVLSLDDEPEQTNLIKGTRR